MSRKLKIIVYSVVSSPYQRDLFYELSQLSELEINVYYLEQSSPDAPWPEAAFQPYEKMLPGTYIAWGASRFHVNWHLPDVAHADVIVLNGYQNSVAQWILYRYGSQIPCIFWGETMVANSGGLKGALQKAMMQSLNHCSAIAAIGSRAVKDYQQRFPGKPVFDIPYYCDLSEFSAHIPERPRQPVTILFCGQMILRKGVDILLQAFARLIESGLEARLLLVGREAELPEMLAALSPEVTKHIEHTGFQAPEDLPQFFQQADIFVLPSRYDGWGVVVNQAIGAGLPVICSDAVGAALDLVKPGVNGAIVPVGDVEALYKALKEYLQNPDAIKMASQVALAKADSLLPRSGAQRWLEVFQKVT